MTATQIPVEKKCNVSKGRMIAGWILTILPIGLLCYSATMKLFPNEKMINSTKEFGYEQQTMFYLGFVELFCAIVYLVPNTAVLGAILITGYLGGAVATHLRIGQPVFVFPALFGVVAWLGIYLRDPRLAKLVPFRCHKSK